MLLILLACTPEVDPVETEDDGVEWVELSEEDLQVDDGKDDTGSKDDSGSGFDTPCGDDVVAGASCEGDWTTTVCIDDQGVYWWCEGGVWTSDK